MLRNSLNSKERLICRQNQRAESDTENKEE